MKPSDEVDVFASILKPTQFRAFLDAERERAVKELIAVTDMVLVHRAQGRVQLVERMLALLDKAQGGLR